MALSMMEMEVPADLMKRPVYERYSVALRELLRIPGLKAQTDEIRNDLYKLYTEKTDDADGFLQRTAAFEEKYADYLAMPEISYYLKAEADLAKAVRDYLKEAVKQGDLINGR